RRPGLASRWRRPRRGRLPAAGPPPRSRAPAALPALRGIRLGERSLDRRVSPLPPSVTRLRNDIEADHHPILIRQVANQPPQRLRQAFDEGWNGDDLVLARPFGLLIEVDAGHRR